MSGMLMTYVLASLALIVKPGPDLMCTLATALSEGRARACALMCGLILGCWLWILLLAVGAASFFTSHPGVMKGIQVVGLAYIAWLAVGSFREAAASLKDGAGHAFHPATAQGWRLIVRGVAMSMSNPLTILFFLAFMPNFTRDASSPAFRTLWLGTLFCALVPFVYVPVILFADAFRARLSNSRTFTFALKMLSGLILVGVVAVLAMGLFK